MQCKIYEISNEDIEKVKTIVKRIDDNIVATMINKDKSKIKELVSDQEKLNEYLSDKKVLGETNTSDEAINQISEQYGLALNHDEVSNVYKKVDKALMHPLEIANEKNCSVVMIVS